MPTVRKRGDRYQSQVRIKKHGAIVYEESETFDTERQAYLWGYGVEESYKAGKLTKKLDETTVGDVVRYHRKEMERLGKSLRGINHSLKYIEASSLGEMPILEVDCSDIVQFGKERAVECAPSTVLHSLMMLRACYQTARSEMKLKADLLEVVDAIKRLKKLGLASPSTERERRVTDEEIDRIATFHEGLQQTTIPLRLLLKLAIALPRRSGELFGKVLWEDYTGDTLRLRDVKDPKKVRNEVVPVPDEAQAIIAKMPKGKGPICPYNSRSVSVAVYRACEVLGIEDLHLHDLRHEGISRLFEDGLDIPEVALISGHLSWQTLKRYTHLQPKDVLKKLRKTKKEVAHA